MPTISLTITQALADRITALATAAGQTPGQYVRQAIRTQIINGAVTAEMVRQDGLRAAALTSTAAAQDANVTAAVDTLRANLEATL